MEHRKQTEKKFVSIVIPNPIRFCLHWPQK